MNVCIKHENQNYKSIEAVPLVRKNVWIQDLRCLLLQGAEAERWTVNRELVIRGKTGNANIFYENNYDDKIREN